MNGRLLAMVVLAACGASAADRQPTMGWSSWNTYRVNISEDLIRKQADAMVAGGFAAAGYRYVNIDDGWFGGRDAKGRHTFNPARFPNGLKPVVDYIHAKGLKAGIYSDAGENTCGSMFDNDKLGVKVGFYGHDAEDADFYFDELGFDFIKVDFGGGMPQGNSTGKWLDRKERYTAIDREIARVARRTGRDIRMNVCCWDHPGDWVLDLEVAGSWRMSSDIAPNWQSVKDIIAKNTFLASRQRPGHYNDMDMLEVGRGMTQEEDRTHFGMWCMMASPLLIGCDLTTIGPETAVLLKNADLIALDQDPLGLQARLVREDVFDQTAVYAKELAPTGAHEKAVALYNASDAAHEIVCDLGELGYGGAVKVRDCFGQRDLADAEGRIVAQVPAHGTRIYRLRPAKGCPILKPSAFAPEKLRVQGWRNRRTLHVFGHGSDPAWGAKDPDQRDEFVVATPRDGKLSRRSPLYVVLHSAGHNGMSPLHCIDNPEDHAIYTPPDGFFGLFLDCAKNRGTDWWWGQDAAGTEPAPVEKRVMACVAWTIRAFDIDPERVYLCGNSMGGSGALGIGLVHGDVFAAIKANVPAGVIHCSNRMGFGAAQAPRIPDPPVCVDYSAPNDEWSKGHNAFYKAMAERRYALLGFWGDFGHANKLSDLNRQNDIIHAFDWTAVRLHEAYPVFTKASSDTPIAFEFGKGPAGQPGQVNGFFRWKSLEDSTTRLALELRLVTPDELKSAKFTPPASATAEVAVRRCQDFRVRPGDTVKWSFGSVSGTATVGADGLLACSKPLTITSAAGKLVFEKIAMRAVCAGEAVSPDNDRE